MEARHGDEGLFCQTGRRVCDGNVGPGRTGQTGATELQRLRDGSRRHHDIVVFPWYGLSNIFFAGRRAPRRHEHGGDRGSAPSSLRQRQQRVKRLHGLRRLQPCRDEDVQEPPVQWDRWRHDGRSEQDAHLDHLRPY